MGIDVSVIVVNWNTRDYLRRALQSISDQGTHLKTEVFVVDNASTDGSAEMVQADSPETLLIRNPSNRGFAAGNNQAFRIARGRYFLLLNSDAALLAGAINSIVEYADSQRNVGIIGGQILTPEGGVQPSCMTYPSLRTILLQATCLSRCFPRSRWLGGELLAWDSHDCVRSVDAVEGSFLVVRRSAIEECGGFDERFFMYCEELDLCRRIKRHGWEVHFIPAARAVHAGKASASRMEHEAMLQAWASKLLFIEKFHSRAYAKLCRWAVLMTFGLRVPAFAFAALVTPANRNRCLNRAVAYARGAFLLLRGRTSELEMLRPQTSLQADGTKSVK